MFFLLVLHCDSNWWRRFKFIDCSGPRVALSPRRRAILVFVWRGLAIRCCGTRVGRLLAYLQSFWDIFRPTSLKLYRFGVIRDSLGPLRGQLGKVWKCLRPFWYAPRHSWVPSYVRTYVRTYASTYVCTYVRMYVCTYVCMYVRMYVCTYVLM